MTFGQSTFARRMLVSSAWLYLCLPACSSPADTSPAAGADTSSAAPASTTTAAAGTSAAPTGSSMTKPATAGSSAMTTRPAGMQTASGTAGGSATAPATGGSSATAPASSVGGSGTAGGSATAPSTATAGTSGGSNSQGPAAGSGMTAPAEPQKCEGKGKAGRMMASLENAGVTRNYIINVPSSYTGNDPVPLVLYFHPLLTNAATAEGSSMYTALSAREGFIVVYPDGQESAAWNVGPCCTQSRDVDDVGFAKAVVAAMKENYCVDAKRVYAAGFSMGGGMAHYLGCEAADVFAAIAPGAFDLLKENTCAPARPISVIAFRSESDVVVPYEGGVKQNAPNGFVGEHTFLGAVNTFKKWAEVDGCTGEPVMEAGGCETYKQCKDGVEVTLCTVGGGHTWPPADRSWETLKRFTMP